MTITWPIAFENANLFCDGQLACSYMDFPYPPWNESLTVQCDTLQECTGSHIICPTDAQCNIECSAEQSCSYVQYLFCSAFLDDTQQT